jgi:hypothetical protein
LHLAKQRPGTGAAAHAGLHAFAAASHALTTGCHCGSAWPLCLLHWPPAHQGPLQGVSLAHHHGTSAITSSAAEQCAQQLWLCCTAHVWLLASVAHSYAQHSSNPQLAEP